MEARLDDLLSRIAMETDEIKELEQQLTDGQILANKALQRDLKEVICGLQEYLRGLGQQTCSQLQADRLQDENQRLQRFLEEARGLCRQQEEDRSHAHTKVRVAPSLGSQGTQDSGLELQFPSSPDRGQQQGGPSAGGGYWVFVPMVHQERECVCSDDQNNDGLSDRSCRGGSPPPPPPASPPVTAAAASAGGTDARTSLRGSASPSSKSASLRCRPPKQKHTEDAECLKEKKELQMETKWLRHKLRQHRCVLQVCDELACLEETLLKRRAELRESDRLLLEAERLRGLTGGQVDVLLLRHLTSTSSLLEAAQHLRELRRRREEEQLTLWEVEAAIRSRHQEFKQLDTKMKAAANRLAGVLSDCQEAQRHLESLTCQEKHKEQRLARMKEEHRAALGQLAELREEQKLQSIIKDLLEQQEALWSKKSSTVSDVRSEEQKLVSVKAEHRSHRAELKRVLREERSRMQEQVVMKRKELSAPQQLGQKDVKQLRDELQEKLNRRRRKRSSLQEQCRQLETRRRHTVRRLSVLEAERSHTHFIK
uniref:GRB10 interacting GYF protein 2 n=1 Tax=Nothobranchius rachovii TaxID=451742 RepID=A0A1A8QCY4_9TELE